MQRESKPKTEEEKGEGQKQREKEDSISNPTNKMRKKEMGGGEKRWKHSRKTAVTETMGQEKRRENSAEISR